VVVFIEFANALLPIRLSSLRVLSSPSFSLSCARVVCCSPACPLGSLVFNSQSRCRSRRLPSSHQTRHPLLDPHLTSSLQTQSRRRSARQQKNPKNWVKTKLAARYFPSARQISWIEKSLPISRIRVSCGNSKLINYSK
jgi:hypothetical protein